MTRDQIKPPSPGRQIVFHRLLVAARKSWLVDAEGVEYVSGFESAEESVVQLPRHAPDVVLMDIKLHGLSGVECVRRLKPVLPQTQFVMHTVYEDSNQIFDALQAGATGYLLKQAAHDELLAAIKYVNTGGSPMTCYIARRVAQAFHQEDATVPESAMLSPRASNSRDRKSTRLNSSHSSPSRMPSSA